MHDRPPSSVPIDTWTRAKSRFARWLYRFIPSAYERWALAGARAWHQNDIPWSDLDKPLSKARVALINSGGIILESQQPFDLNDPRGDSSYRVIPAEAELGDIRISHAFYDTDRVRRDVEVLFPLKTLHGLAAEGIVGSVAPRHFSFSGNIPDPSELVSDFAPEVRAMLVSDEVDLVLLTPA